MESPLQQDGASKDALYSLVVSVKSSPPIHEVYIDTYLHYTALKVTQYSSYLTGSNMMFTPTDSEITTHI